jgi:hypothetical protein
MPSDIKELHLCAYSKQSDRSAWVDYRLTESPNSHADVSGRDRSLLGQVHLMQLRSVAICAHAMMDLVDVQVGKADRGLPSYPFQQLIDKS